MSSKPIGIFDSGVGGLTVLKEINRLMPNEGFVYFGDTANNPYGDKNSDALLGYGRSIINFLISQNVKAVLIACGTSSATVYDRLKSEYRIPVADVICPAVDAVSMYLKKPIGVIATESTVSSGVFEKKIIEKYPEAIVRSVACPLFVQLIEEGWAKKSVTRIVAESYLEAFGEKKIGSLVMGCTHYPLIVDVLTEILPDVPLIDMAEPAVNYLQKILGDPSEKKCEIKKFFVSGDEKKFSKLAGNIMGIKIKANKVVI